MVLAVMHTSDTVVDGDGWRFGPVPDDETTTDVLMEHSYNMGRRDADLEKGTS